ncbi:MAG: anthranilate synthase component I, partial [Xenococcaceae cyanobacterium]
MYLDNHSYTTKGGVNISRFVTDIAIETAVEEVLFRLDSQRGGLLTSSYEYPGRYKRWGIGFFNPPLELVTRENSFTFKALNDRGLILLIFLADRFYRHPQLMDVLRDRNSLTGFIRKSDRLFSEEERSRQPSVFSVVREIISVFESDEDEQLGLYGAFGYDLVFQFEQMSKRLKRADNQRDLVLYLPDELVIIDYYLQKAFRLQYEF